MTQFINLNTTVFQILIIKMTQFINFDDIIYKFQ